MDFTDRLLAVMSHYGHNKNSFSIAIGTSNNTVIGRLVNERERRPSFDLIELILKKFPAINPSWLILGEGEMFINRPNFVPNPKDRIIKACELLKINAFKLAELTGLSKQVAIELRNGTKEPTMEELEKISEALTLINTNWLLYNEGDIFIESVNQEKFVPFFEEIPAGSTMDDIKHLDVSFSNYTTKTGIKNVFGVRNQSNDFTPFLVSGDYVGVREVSFDDLIPSDLVFVSTKQRNYIRRIAKQVSPKAEAVTLIDNLGISYDIRKSDITLIGRIFKILRYIN